MNLFEDESVKELFARYLNITNLYKVVYTGQGVSLNDYYSAGHWSKRAAIKKKYHAIFIELLEKSNVRDMDQFSLLVAFNSRHDTDNVTGLEKVFMDTLKTIYVKEDSKKYYRGYMVLPNEGLPLNTFEFYLIEHAK